MVQTVDFVKGRRKSAPEMRLLRIVKECSRLGMFHCEDIRSNGNTYSITISW